MSEKNIRINFECNDACQKPSKLLNDFTHWLFFFLFFECVFHAKTQTVRLEKSRERKRSKDKCVQLTNWDLVIINAAKWENVMLPDFAISYRIFNLTIHTLCYCIGTTIAHKLMVASAFVPTKWYSLYIRFVWPLLSNTRCHVYDIYWRAYGNSSDCSKYARKIRKKSDTKKRAEKKAAHRVDWKQSQQISIELNKK